MFGFSKGVYCFEACANDGDEWFTSEGRWAEASEAMKVAQVYQRRIYEVHGKLCQIRISQIWELAHYEMLSDEI